MAKILGWISANFTDNLGSITEHRSLASLPFGGRYRLVDFALSNMTNSGINTVSLITPYMYRSILDHVGAGREWSLSRKVGGLLILPGAVYGLKGSKGKFLMRDLIENRISLDRSNADVVLMMSSNKVFNFNFSEIADEHVASGRDITMFYKPTQKCEERQGNFLTVNREGTVTNIRNSATGTDNLSMECMLISRKLLINMIDWYKSAAHFDLVDAIADSLDKLVIAGYEYKKYVGNIDSIVDYMKCSRDLLDTEVQNELFEGNPIYTKIQDNAPTRYWDGCEISNSIVPAGCDIRGHVENSIIFRGVKVGEGAIIKNSIILQRSVIEPYAQLEDVICDKGVTISAGTKLFGVPNRPCVIGKAEVY